MAVERRLTEIVGAVGGKLHTARSRNDQVATDMAMFTRAHALRAIEALQDLQTAIVRLAEAHLDWPMPGYTHLQRAQPVYLSHHLLAYFWMFRRDARRFEAVLGSTTELPLGAGALAGVNFATDRGFVASELGFAGVAPNSIDAVSNRDFVLDFSRRRRHLRDPPVAAGRRDRPVVLGGVRVLRGERRVGVGLLDHAAEEEPGRGRAAAREGAPRGRRHLAALHGVMHGLPLTYNKDMQEDKEHLFDAVDTLELCLAAARGMLSGMTFKRERLAAAASDEMIAAVDVADMLVTPRRAVPAVARDRRGARAHGGRVGPDAVASLSREELAEHSDVLDDEFYAVLSQGTWLESKVSEGGTALDRVREQLAHARAALEATS